MFVTLHSSHVMNPCLRGVWACLAIYISTGPVFVGQPLDVSKRTYLSITLCMYLSNLDSSNHTHAKRAVLSVLVLNRVITVTSFPVMTFMWELSRQTARAFVRIVCPRFCTLITEFKFGNVVTENKQWHRIVSWLGFLICELDADLVLRLPLIVI